MSPRRPHGSLEAAVLRLLWTQGSARTGRQIREALNADGDDLATTTVLTVLSRLQKKGLVEREPSSKAFRAARTDPVETADWMSAALGRSRDRTAVLQRFTGSLDAADLHVLRVAIESSGIDHADG
jgi:predicted transcriptional regulator